MNLPWSGIICRNPYYVAAMSADSNTDSRHRHIQQLPGSATLQLCRRPREEVVLQTAWQVKNFYENMNSACVREWFVHVPCRLEANSSLLFATRAVASAIQRIAWSGHNAQNSRISDYNRAIALLRRSALDTESALLSVVSLMYYEMLMGTSMKAFQTHLRGLCSVLLRFPEKWARSEVARTVLYSSRIVICESFIMQGKPSPFEQAIWRQMDPPDCGSQNAKHIIRLSHHILIELPRVIGCVRKLRLEPCCSSETHDVNSRIRKLLTIEDRETEAALLSTATRTETLSEVDRPFVPASLEFDAFISSYCLVEYCRARLLALNLYCYLLSSSELVAIAPQLSLAAFQTQRVRMVDNILMCWQDHMRAGRLAQSMALALYPVWDAIGSLHTYNGLDSDDILPWLELKCIIANRNWKAFRGAGHMNATCNMYKGGPPEHAFFNVDDNFLEA